MAYNQEDLKKALRAVGYRVLVDHLKSNLPIIVWENGQVKELDPWEALRMDYARLRDKDDRT